MNRTVLSVYMYILLVWKGKQWALKVNSAVAVVKTSHLKVIA
jgi:hypothetical protein